MDVVPHDMFVEFLENGLIEQDHAKDDGARTFFRLTADGRARVAQ
jgi:hypothetical protein